MPVIIVGADTLNGMRIASAFAHREREVRVFVSDPEAATKLRDMGAKVALGDVSDEGHMGAAATRCFSAVLITEAAADGREISFARTPDEVVDGWARAMVSAEVSRVIWVTEGSFPEAEVNEVAVVDPSDRDLVSRVVALDDAQTIM